MEASIPGRRLGYSLLSLAGALLWAGCNDASPTDPNTDPKSFTIALASSNLTISPGGTTTTTVTVTALNGAGPVTLTVEGAPTGLTAAFNPSPATTSSVLTVTAVSALLPGSYTLTVRGTGAGVADQTATLTVHVVAAGTGTITMNFAACPVAERPAWFAAQDGVGGAWTQVTGVADAYSFSLTQPKGGIAFATTTDSSVVTVEYFAATDLPTNSVDYVVRLDRCPTLVGETINGSTTGLGAGEEARVSIGTANARVIGNAAFTLLNARDGTMDLVGFKSMANDPTTGGKVFLRRGINPADNSSVGAMDFTSGTESFTPASATMTIANLIGGETYRHSMHYYTAGGVDICQVSNLYVEVPGSGSTFTGVGVAPGQQLGTDWHAVGLFTTVSANSFRTLHQYMAALAPTTLTLGTELPVPTMSVLAGPYKRVQGAWTMPTDYLSRASLRYQDLGTKTLAIVTATMTWVGGAAVTLSLPDFTGVTGWNNAWAPANGASVFWTALGDNATNPPHCAAGAKYISAMRTGTI